MVLSNPTSIAVYFGLGATPVLGAGIFLTQNGVWEMDAYTFTTASIEAIASAAAVASVAIQEFS